MTSIMTNLPTGSLNNLSFFRKRAPSPVISKKTLAKKCTTPLRDTNLKIKGTDIGLRDFLNEKISSFKVNMLSTNSKGSESDERIFRRQKKPPLEAIGLFKNEYTEYKNLRDIEKETSRKKALYSKLASVRSTSSSNLNIFRLEKTGESLTYEETRSIKKPVSLHVSPEFDKGPNLSLPLPISVKNIDLINSLTDEKTQTSKKTTEFIRNSSRSKLRIELPQQKEKEQGETNVFNFDALQLYSSDMMVSRKDYKRNFHSEDLRQKKQQAGTKDNSKKNKVSPFQTPSNNNLTANFFAAMKNQLKLQQERLNLKYLCYVSQKAREHEQKLFNVLLLNDKRPVVQSTDTKILEPRPSERKTWAHEMKAAGSITEHSFNPSSIQLKKFHIEKDESVNDSGFQSHRLSEGNLIKSIKGDSKRYSKMYESLKQESNALKGRVNKNEKRLSEEGFDLENEIILEPWIGIEDCSLDQSNL